MSLRNFLTFRSHCPLCQSPLDVYLNSMRTQKHSITNNYYSVRIPLRDLTHRYIYEIEYSFNLDDDDFEINIYHKDKPTPLAYLSLQLLQNIKDFNINYNPWNCYIVCNNCDRYLCVTLALHLNLTTSKIEGSFDPYTEYLGLSQKTGNEYKVFKLINNFQEQITHLEYGHSNNPNIVRIVDNSNIFTINNCNLQTLRLPLLPFSSKKQMIERLNKLIIFS